MTHSCVAYVLALAGVLTVSAQSIPVANAGFEKPAVAVRAANGPGIPGWQNFQPFETCSGGVLPANGVAHPLSSQTVPPSDGSQLGFIRLCEPLSNFVWQMLPVNYQPNTNYTFTVDFYRDAGSVATPFGSIAFCHGAHLFCPDPQTIPGTGGPVSTNLFVNPGDTFVGNPITVAIFGVAIPGQERIFYFDHARLEATPRTLHTSGIVGVYAHRPGVTSQLNALCNFTSSPCDVTLEFHDIHGVLVSQSETTLRPGQTASLDQPVSRDSMPDAGELIPRWFLKSGTADVSFEIFDSSTLRSNLFVNWTDGSISKMGNLDSGPVTITPLDTVRVKVYCDGSVRPAAAVVASTGACSATLGFADLATGRILKESRVALQPGTAAYVDLNYEDTAQISPREEVHPQLTVTGGTIVAGIAILDRTTGGTVTQSAPTTAARVGGGDQ
jgi:hypothetical protein